MECKIGEIFEYNGEWYQCVEGICNKECYFYNRSLHKTIADINGAGFGACNAAFRSDDKSVIFKKLRKIGEPYDDCGTILQRFKIYTNVANADTKGLELHIYSNDTIGIEIKQNKEDMKEKNNGNTPLNVLTDKYVNGDICYDDFEKEVKALYSCKEEIKPTLKPFDFEAAKAGKAVCTRDGRKARIICFDKKKDIYPLIALVTDKDGYEIITPYKADGVHPTIPNDDLMMLPEKKEGWVNVYNGTPIYDTKEEALNRASKFRGYIDTVKVGWEE